MSAGTTVKLARNCAAIQIPVGTEVTLKAATPVDIVQTLGGTYTVHSMGGLFRISGKDADALGLTPEPESASSATQVVSEQAVWSVLKTCFDPEIPVNIVDLGLIYNCDLTELGSNSYKADVKMTLTAPGCGMGPVLVQDVQNKLLCLEGIDDVNVELVWDPPWNQGMMTEAARLQLGLM